MNKEAPHIWQSEVRTCELDSMGIVYHGNYLQYLDCGRTYCLKDQGVDWCKIHREQGCLAMVYQIDVKYLKPLREFDAFTVETTFRQSEKLRVIFDQTIIRTKDNIPVVKAEVTVVFVSEETMKPISPKGLLNP